MSTYNIPKQNNRDYFKELKDIQKEIVKIYKQLSKDETLTDILDNIKRDFINNNISIIEDNLSDSKLTNYKDFNSKIIKMLNIFIKILENFNIDKNIEIKDINKLKIYTLEKIKNKEETTFLQQQDLSKTISDIIKKKPSNEEEKEGEFLIFKKNTNLDEKTKKILLNICIFNYYIDIFSNNNKLEIEKEKIIKEKENELNNLKGDKSRDNENKKFELTESLKKAHETNKKIYRDLFSFIKLESSEIIGQVNNNIKKDNSAEYINHVNKFKKEIYYETININNTQVNDEYAKQRENSNEKIDLESRKKLLGEMKELLYKQCNKLNDVLKYLVALNKQEYSKELIAIRKIFPDYTKGKDNTKEKDFISNISILSLIINEETEIAKLLEKNKGDKIIIENAKNNNRKNNNNGYDYNRYRERDRNDDERYPGGGGKYKLRGGEKKDNIYYEEKYTDISELIKYIDALIISIKTNEGIPDIEDPFENKNNKELNIAGKGIASIYKNIWNDYIKETQKNKITGSTIETLKQENRLYERFKEGELDPNDVLKISFEDKIIFIGIILLIRTFTMVLIEFLIDYNAIGTIFRGIVVYSVIYILLIILSVLIINYDSYKLRILVNYLNLHINSSNIVLHIIMFCLLIGLILIIVNNNELDSLDIDNILSYTYVYKYIYEIIEKSKNIYENPDKITTTSYLIISEKEKMKLRYRLDIITMLIFIFSSLLILVM